MDSTHELFCPAIIETHSIDSLTREFQELKLLYQADNELEINELESVPILDESETDAYSSDELPENENEILTPAQLEKFQKIYNSTIKDDDDEE